ncbi:MAG: hypothetical protein JNJ88_09010 [Planctomycetes bacterium]|nr:hypothetical protein [Planctomycetota bacterium]
MSKPQTVLAVYRFKSTATPARIRKLLTDHARVLLQQKLRTQRPAWVLRSTIDPRIVMEIFEWADETAAERAHHNSAVMEIWGRFGELCDEVGMKLSRLPEAKAPFPHFWSAGLEPRSNAASRTTRRRAPR